MPGKVKVKIISGKNLPVMDRSSDTTDAYVEIKLGNTTYKTDVCRRTLHPQWNTDWYRFEVDDSELQDEPLQIRLMDHDTYSANDAIGKVYLNLNPLLLPVGQLAKHGFNNDGTTNHEISGWIPVYDTMHGIRGEVNITVKVELFSDFNRFRQSSCGVQFYYSPTIPQGSYIRVIHGFVEELIVNDDPEYQWIDKIRTPRASNEARQTLFFKLSGELQRKIGVKALNLGGNAVIGYKQSFDLEGESGIVARGIGTAVTLAKHFAMHASSEPTSKEEDIENYLKFVGGEKSFRLSRNMPKPSNVKLPFPEFPPPSFDTSVLNPRSKQHIKRFYSSIDSPAIKPSVSNPTLAEEDDTFIKTLLKQEDKRGTGHGFSKKIKNLKYSQNAFSKKMTALKAKLGDSIGEEMDENTPSSSRKSLFKKSHSDTSVMAELLARSVLQAHHSLGSILEDPNQSQEEESTIEKLEPIANLLGKTMSEPSDENYSDHQSDTTTESSSSDYEEYDDRDFRKSNVDLETISNIIDNVEKMQRTLKKESLQKQYSLPTFPSRIYSVDSSRESINDIGAYQREIQPAFSVSDISEKSKNQISNFTASETNIPTASLEKSEFKFPATSLKSDLNRSPSRKLLDRIRNPFSNIKSDSPNLVTTAMQTMLFEQVNLDIVDIPREKNEISDNNGQIKSTEHVETTEAELPKPKKEIYKCQIEHHPKIESPMSNVKINSPSLLGTALQTMLIEQVNLDFADLSHGKVIVPENSDYSSDNTRGISESRCETHHSKVESPMSNVKIDSPNLLGTALQTMLVEQMNVDIADISHGKVVIDDNLKDVPEPPENKVGSLSRKEIIPLSNVNIDSSSLVGTAMQTMLLEKVNIMGTYTPPTSPVFTSKNDGDGKRNFDFNTSTTEGEKLPKKMPKSMSLATFSEYIGNNKETVLGIPFTALPKLRADYMKQLSNPCLLDSIPVKSPIPKINTQLNLLKNQQQTSFSDSNLLEPLDKENSHKHKFKFFHLKHKTHSHESSLDDKKKFKLFKKLSNADSHKNILSRIFHKHDKETLTDKISIDEGTQTSTEFLELSHKPTPVPPETKITKTDLPVDIEIEHGDSCSKTKHACITPNRHNISSPSEQNGGNIQDQLGTEPSIKPSQSPAKSNASAAILRRSSDSDLSITPKGNSLTGSDRSTGNPPGYFMKNNHVMRAQVNQENFDMLEYPFLTTTKFPPNFVVQIGGAVSARSVKLLERITNVEEPESRDIWWSEIRMEIRSHARSLNCNAVLGYSESASIGEDICVLSACGTAAVIEFYNFDETDENVQLVSNKFNYANRDIISTSLDRCIEKEKPTNDRNSNTKSFYDSPDHIPLLNDTCLITHLPYDKKKVPVKAKISKCRSCGKGKVPEVLIATIEPPDNISNLSRGCFIESYVCRPIKDVRGEYVAKEISDGLPFLEYELHRLLLNKLRIKGMNAIFSLKIRISVGERMMVGIGTGTALYLSSLPQPILPTLVSDRTSDEKKLADLQEALNETVRRNKEIYQIKDESHNGKCFSDDDSDEEPTSLDLPLASKDCCVLEVDDPDDAEVLDLLMEERIPDGFHVVNTESVPGLEDLEIVKNLQMFTQIYRTKFHPPFNLHKHFLRLLQSVYFKLRRMVPCALCDLQFRVDVPEPDELQLCVIGMALGLGKKQRKPKQTIISKRFDDDLIFKLDEDQMMENVQPTKFAQSSLKYKQQKSPAKYPRTQSLKHRHIPHKERHGVDITPLSYVPGGKIEQYLGNINFFFIRETTSIREEGGLSGFIHSFLTEVLAIVRAHVTALGGNALVAFFLTECILNHNLHKNQGQCLINVGGDVVSVSYFKEENC